MQAFLGGHPAVDFLNSAYFPIERRVETIGEGRAFLRWLVETQLVTDEAASRLLKRAGAKALDAAAVDARKLREWAREWLSRWKARPQADYKEEFASLNRYLAKLPFHHHIARSPRGVTLLAQTDLEDAESLLGVVALQIARLVVEEDAALLKGCAGPECTLWFLDRTKAHSRMFCSPSTCGNRAKVAAFRERQRGG